MRFFKEKYSDETLEKATVGIGKLQKLGYTVAFDLKSRNCQALNPLGDVEHDFESLYDLIEFADTIGDTKIE